ncbi:MAG: BlaI/MecI/CopY family transcriptional regulator [Planctomycetota bacterium]
MAARPAAEAPRVSDPQPTGRELDALKALWRAVDFHPPSDGDADDPDGPPGATVREVADAIAASGEELAYTTVLSLLQVMEQKGLVAHTRRGKAYVYRPLIERQSTFRGLAAGFLDRVFDGAVSEYLVHAIGDRRLSAEELDRLESMIADARAKHSKPRRGSKPRGPRKGGDR